MKVYEPKKELALIADVIKDIYLLREAMKHEAGCPEALIKNLDNIRKKVNSIKDVIEEG
jgi:hypothetical protein